MLDENYCLRGYIPLGVDRSEIVYTLIFIVEDSSGSNYLCNSEGSLIELFEGLPKKVRKIYGDLKINIRTHALFQRANNIYLALRSNDLFNRISVFNSKENFAK